jgi:DNA-binding NarL/FixJ family response regulator
MADIRVVLVDDHPIVRDGLRQVLGEAPGLKVLSACADCGETIRAVARYRPDILVMDARLPDRDGVGAIPEILAASPATRVVLFTATVNEERAVEALRLGASAVLLKSTPAAQLIETIGAVAAGTGWITPGASGSPIDSDAAPAVAGLVGKLTPREREVAELVASGARNKQIAWKLGVAEGTVKLHITRAFRKLRVGSRVGLARVLAEQADPESWASSQLRPRADSELLADQGAGVGADKVDLEADRSKVDMPQRKPAGERVT